MGNAPTKDGRHSRITALSKQKKWPSKPRRKLKQPADEKPTAGLFCWLKGAASHYAFRLPG